MDVSRIEGVYLSGDIDIFRMERDVNLFGAAPIDVKYIAIHYDEYI